MEVGGRAASLSPVQGRSRRHGASHRNRPPHATCIWPFTTTNWPGHRHGWLPLEVYRPPKSPRKRVVTSRRCSCLPCTTICFRRSLLLWLLRETKTKLLCRQEHLPRVSDLDVHRSYLLTSADCIVKYDGPWFTTQLTISATVGVISFLIFSYCRTRYPLLFAPRTKLKGTPLWYVCCNDDSDMRYYLAFSPHEAHAHNAFFGWILPTIRVSEYAVLQIVGLDAAVVCPNGHHTVVRF